MKWKRASFILKWNNSLLVEPIFASECSFVPHVRLSRLTAVKPTEHIRSETRAAFTHLSLAGSQVSALKIQCEGNYFNNITLFICLFCIVRDVLVIKLTDVLAWLFS